ncbi:MAG TPA: hypothetical protein VFB74_35050 [Kribbellaceae bacterium]|nr:hypothetical protein [Kribbellaceae bacterium]
MSTYIGAMEGDDTEANALLDDALATTRDEKLTERVGGMADRAQAEQQVLPPELTAMSANCSLSPVLTYHSQRAPSGRSRGAR